ncbi:MAG: DUF721 domain-containing protein [Desulfuromonadales bacterium]|nr:DUF721 domain-containing protein [Desulfuromonadales bacterium]
MRKAARAGDLVEGLLAGWGLDERLQQYQALIIWDEVVGPQIAARARPERIRDGVLEICVDQPTWMQQLQLLKPQILTKLNARLGEGSLREIFLKRGKVAARTTAASKPPAPAWRKMMLSGEETTELRTLLAGVEDEELRRDLENLLAKQLKLTKAKNQS